MIRFIHALLQQILSFLSLYIDEIKDEKEPERKLELQYFDMKGLAECIRLTMQYGGLDFKDTKFSQEEFNENVKNTLLFQQLPHLIVTEDGVEDCVVQSKAILRYVGRLTHTYPCKISINAALVDQWVELHTEFMNPLILDMYPARFGVTWTATEKECHRKWCIEQHIPKYFEFLNKNLLEHEMYLGGMENPSIADFCWYTSIDWISSGIFDGVNESIFEDFPELKAYKSVIEDVLYGAKEEDEDDESSGDNCSVKEDDESSSDNICSVKEDEKKIL